MVCINQLKRQKANRRGSYFYHVNDGFYYHLNCRKKNNVVYFKCIRYETGCLGRALCDRQRGFLHTNPHDVCIRDPYLRLVRQLRSRILMRCKRLELKTFREILTEESARFPVRVQAQVRMSNMRSCMQQARMSSCPPPPQTLEELAEILRHPRFHIITQNDDGTDNIFARSVTGGDGRVHSIIFMSQRMARVLKTMSILFGDGTFKSLPAMEGLDHETAQIFALVANWDHTVIPLGWVLMERRLQVHYEDVLRTIRALVGNFSNLDRFVSDFEPAIRNAVAAVFPGVTLQGCFFHLFRAFVRYAKVDLGMHPILRRQPYERLIKLFCALPLLPFHLILRGFFLLMRQARQAGLRVYRRLRPFIAYVWRNWVGPPLRRSWMCVYKSFHRTNNTCESHNKILNLCVKIRHPNIYHFLLESLPYFQHVLVLYHLSLMYVAILLVALLALEKSSYADTEALRIGNPPNRGRTVRAISLDRRLRSLARVFDNPPDNIDDAILRYLEAALHSFDRAYDRAVDDVR